MRRYPKAIQSYDQRRVIHRALVTYHNDVRLAEVLVAKADTLLEVLNVFTTSNGMYPLTV
jgi:hypothetical protein